MKHIKLLIGMGLLAGALLFPKGTARAGNEPEIYTKIGPSTATSQITLSAVPGKRNCLSNVDYISDAAFTFRVLDGGTTVYALTYAAAGGAVRSWDTKDAVCGTANTAMILKISAGNYSINYQGYTY